jgi:hypothetical protein
MHVLIAILIALGLIGAVFCVGGFAGFWLGVCVAANDRGPDA